MMLKRMAPRRDQRGFTLVELMITLTILALAMGLAGTTLLRRGTGFEVRAFTGEVMDALREARARAAETGQAVVVEFRGDERQFRTSSGRLLSLPEAIEASVTSAESAGRGRIVFYQNGGSSGGTFEIFNDLRRETITIDWLTGSIEKGPRRRRISESF